jgi:hypothetical protein
MMDGRWQVELQSIRIISCYRQCTETSNTKAVAPASHRTVLAHQVHHPALLPLSRLLGLQCLKLCQQGIQHGDWVALVEAIYHAEMRRTPMRSVRPNDLQFDKLRRLGYERATWSDQGGRSHAILLPVASCHSRGCLLMTMVYRGAPSCRIWYRLPRVHHRLPTSIE